METTHAQRTCPQQDLNIFSLHAPEPSPVERRLNVLLAANAEIESRKNTYRTDRERLEAEMMTSPLTTEKAFAYFGLMLGLFPPLSLLIKFFTDSQVLRPDDLWILPLLFLANVFSAVVGYFSGKVVGRSVAAVEKIPLWAMMLVLPFVGLLWGMVSGAAGGLPIFIVGAFFGAFVGGAVGAAALPVFALLHRLVKRGDMIELKHFLPLAFGVTLSICSFILGL
jgi:hypothetical protein